jgi:hypothetical protein
MEDGRLRNPAATPDLEEEAEREAREQPEHVYYEIADENTPSQAEQESERYEGQIARKILKTALLSGSSAASATPDSPPEQSKSNPAAPQTSGAAAPPEEAPASADQPSRLLAGGLRPMPTIDEMIEEHGRAETFHWFERHAAKVGTVAPHSAESTSAARPASGAPAAAAPASPKTAAVPEKGTRQPGQKAGAFKPTRFKNLLQLRLPGASPWRRIGVIGVLALSLLMLGVGFALIPSASVSYHEEFTLDSETLLFDTDPAAIQQSGTQQIALAHAGVARFDGIITTYALATGRRNDPSAPDRLVAFPTQEDIDQTVSSLQAQLQSWGETAISSQAQQGDILGPLRVQTEALASPPAGTSLPAGAAAFQVSLALHLRATLIRHQTLVQAAQNQLRQVVRHKKPGFAPQPGHAPVLTTLSVESTGPGNTQLHLQVQAIVMIGPALTPDQARSAIAGMSVPDAEAYLNSQPGISAASISIQPKWPNRLPIFPVRITIKPE